jgi:thiamine-phosphate pyrophosphorylase
MKRQNIKDGSLYLVISQECCKGRGALDVARRAIAGGIDIIQMREKGKPREELVGLGKQLSELCLKNQVIFIVNDDPTLAVDVGADGVHMGQEDLKACPIEKARSIVGPDGTVGVSTHSLEQFEKANSVDVDYIAYGPVFETKTKDYFLGASEVNDILHLARKPVFFIGGINLSNAGTLLDRGAKNIAMIRAITESSDVTESAKKFKELLKNGNKNKRQN